MATVNPYATPEAALERGSADNGVYDETSVLSPKGRFGRINYIYWSIAFGLIFMIINRALAMVFGEPDLSGIDPINIMAVIMAAIGPADYILWTVSIPVTIILAIRRLHDMNRSGWLSILALVPLFNLLLFLALWFWPGTNGANDYGPPPKPYSRFQAFVAYFFAGLMLIAFVGGIVAAIAIPALNGGIPTAP